MIDQITSNIGLVEVFYYALTGAFAGIAAGMFGIGGGLIIVPVLYHVFASQGYDSQHLMHMAIATSLAAIVFTASSSTLAHHKRNAVLWRIVFSITPGIIIGAWFGGIFASKLDNEALSKVFAIFELLVAIHLIFKKQSRQHQATISKIVATIGGLAIGFISSIVGIAGGTMTGPFLHWFNVPMQKAVATSAACGLPIALIGTLAYVYTGWGQMPDNPAPLGFLQIDALVTIAISSFLFAPLGAKLAHNISEKALRLSFAGILLSLSAIMFIS